MAGIRTVTGVVKACMHAQITPFIWGHRGLGKSSLVRQLATEEGIGFIDLRCSQLEASDIRGLPDRGADGRTHYLPPADMPVADMTSHQITKELAGVLGLDGDNKDVVDEIAKKLENADLNTKRLYYNKLQSLQSRFQRGILFLDEVNRAQDDVLQALFQLVLDHRIGNYVLPPGWSIVAAGNYMEGYRTGGFDDSAFLNRFCHVDLSGGDTTLEDWISYMASKHGEHAAEAIEFASQNVKHLDGDVNGERGFTVQPSRRSWEMVVKVSSVFDKLNTPNDVRTEVFAGLIGRELALSYTRYRCPVKPKDLIENGVKKYAQVLGTLERTQLTGLMWGLIAACKPRINDDKIGTVCIDFASYMLENSADKDIVVAFCRALVSSGDPNDSQEKTRAAVISNPELARMLSNFRKKRGDSKSFVDRLAENPKLQEHLAAVAWGESK